MQSRSCFSCQKDISRCDHILNRIADTTDLVAALKKDGHDFSVGIPMDTPIPQAERVVSAGKGIGEKKNMKLVESLAQYAAAIDVSDTRIVNKNCLLGTPCYLGIAVNTSRLQTSIDFLEWIFDYQ